MEYEIWKNVTGFEQYQVSNKGRVRSLKNGNPRIMKGFMNNKGYFVVDLSKNGIRNHKYIHRLVALEFVDGYFEGAIVNHKDENPKNNKQENLEWCTYQYNINYSNNLKKARKANVKKVAKFDTDGKLIKKYESITEAARDNRVSGASISNCLLWKHKTSCGFLWKYQNNEVEP